jgi:hypothetical protein
MESSLMVLACFQKFGDNISEARRAGDVDPEKKLMQPLYIEPVTSLDKCRVPFFSIKRNESRSICKKLLRQKQNL